MALAAALIVIPATGCSSSKGEAGSPADAGIADVGAAEAQNPAPSTGPLTGVAAVSGGSQYTCALMRDGTARCWGENAAGELGDGTFASSPLPVPVMGLSGAKAINAGPHKQAPALEPPKRRRESAAFGRVQRG